MVGPWAMSNVLDLPFENWTSYIRKQDGIGLSGIQMVGLSGIQVAFKNWTNLFSTVLILKKFGIQIPTVVLLCQARANILTIMIPQLLLSSK